MSNFKHILFPVDFSDRCCNALPFVENFANRYSSKVTLLNAVHVTYAGGLAGPAIVDPDEVLRYAKDRLDSAFRDNFKQSRVDRVVQLGEPAEVIRKFVEENGVDLVMMPSHGYGPFRQLLLGSVTAKVLHDINVPVWTAAHTENAEHSHVAIRKILCAVDGSPSSAALMQSAANLGKDWGADLRLVHIVPGVEAWPEQQMDLEYEEAIRNSARRVIEEMESTAGIDAPFCISVGSVADTVAEEASRHASDLVLIGRGVLQHTLGRLRTHAHGIIRLAPCPVLSI